MHFDDPLGIAVDGNGTVEGICKTCIELVKKKGKVKALEDEIECELEIFTFFVS